MRFFKSIVIAFAALHLSNAQAQNRINTASIDFGGVTLSETLQQPFSCNQNDQVPISYPAGSTNGLNYVGDSIGGGSPPSGPFIIVQAALSVESNDPLVESMVGQLGPHGDNIIAHNVGPGTFYMPPGIVIPNANALSDQIHVHISCARWRALTGQNPSWGGVYFAIVHFTFWYIYPQP